MAIGDELLNAPTNLPVIPQAPPAPPIPLMDPAQFAQAMQGYQGAFAGMPSQALNPALLRFGFNLLQPIRPGDSPGGLLSRSAIDAMNYYEGKKAQEVNQALAGFGVAQQERAGQVAAATGAEQVASARQQRGISAAVAPTALATAQAAYQKARAELDLVRQEELAGTRDPEFLQRKAAAEVAVREALAEMYKAHSGYYQKAGEAVPGKGAKQTLNVKTVENADGTTSLVSTIVVNGQPYNQVFTPARFTDVKAATDFATREVNKETPSAWNPFAGAAPYQGTAQEEIARRVKEYMAPRVSIVDPQGRPMTPQQFDAIGGPTPGVAPKPLMPPASPRESAQERTGAAERSLQVIRGELRDARKRSAPPEDIAALEKEEANAVKRVKGGAPGFAPEVGKTAVRGPDGKLQWEGQPQTTAPRAPVAAAASVAPPTRTTEQVVSDLQKARTTLYSFGMRQQRADPAGYRNALLRVSQLQNELAEVQEEAVRSITPTIPGAGMQDIPRRP